MRNFFLEEGYQKLKYVEGKKKKIEYLSNDMLIGGQCFHHSFFVFVLITSLKSET